MFYPAFSACRASEESGREKKELSHTGLLRMRCYGDDRDRSLVRAVIPEDPVGSWSFLLDIRLEDLFPVRAFERPKFVRLQRRMAQVGFKKSQAFPEGFKNIPLRGIVFNLRRSASAWGVKISSCIGCYLACLAKDPRLMDPF